MTDYEALFQTIRENPDDDTPRLVLADWLEEHDQPERAEFIRVQCRRAQLPSWEWERQELLWREQVLLAHYESEWRGSFTKAKPNQWGMVEDGWGAFERGFIETLGLTNNTLSPDLLAATKISDKVILRCLELRGEVELAHTLPGLRELRCDHEQLVHLPKRFPQLREVRFSGSYMQPGERAWIEPLRAVPTIRCEHEGGVVLVRSMLNKGWSTTLTHLELTDSYLYHDYENQERLQATEVQALVRVPAMKNLRVLKITGAELDALSLGEVLRSPELLKLRELVLNNNDIDLTETFDESGTPLDADWLPASTIFELEQLDLSANRLGNGVWPLVQLNGMHHLKMLKLEDCELNSEGLQQLVDAPCWQSLRVLNLSRNALGSQGMKILAQAAIPRHLHTLLLEDCDLNPKGIEILASIPWLHQIRALSLYRNRLSDEDVHEVARGHLGQLRSLNLGENLLTPLVGTALEPLAPGIVELNLRRNPGLIEDFGESRNFRMLVQSLAGFPRLQSLDLSFCNLRIDCFEALVSENQTPALASLCRMIMGGNRHNKAKVEGVLRPAYPQLEIEYLG